MSGAALSTCARKRIEIATLVITMWTATIACPAVLAQAPVPAPAAGTLNATAPTDETATAEGQAGGRWSRLLERLLFNPRERTVRGLDAVARARTEEPANREASGTSSRPAPPAGGPPGSAAGNAVAPGPASPDAELSAAAPPGASAGPTVTNAEQAADAIAPFDSAARLLGDDARGAYNAGTARLLAERADAAPLLESILDTEDDQLAANAAFNLGNSHLETGQLEGAVDAYKKALRRDPARANAKHNLEIALRRLRAQQQQQEQQQQNQEQGDQEEQDQQQDGDQDQQDQQDGDQDQQDGDQDQQDGDQDQQGDPEQQPPQDRDPQEQEQEQPQDGDQGEQEESPLPQFEDQPDMTAEEAAAILEAVENLEREARRQAALEAAREQAKGKKDW